MISYNSFKIHPDPVKNILSIDGFSFNVEYSITIFDAAGRMIKQLKFTPNEKIISMNINDVNSGIYFIKIQCAQGITSLKFVKQ